MKQIYTFTIIIAGFLFSPVAWGQGDDQRLKDSLLSVIHASEGADKLTAYAILTTQVYSNEQADTHFRYFMEAIREAQKQGNKQEEIQAEVYIEMGEFEKAAPLLDLAEKQIAYRERSWIDICYYKALIAEWRKDYPLAMKLCDESHRLCEVTGEYAISGDVLKIKARVLSKMRQSEDLFDLYEQYIAVRDSVEKQKQTTTAYYVPKAAWTNFALPSTAPRVETHNCASLPIIAPNFIKKRTIIAPNNKKNTYLCNVKISTVTGYCNPVAVRKND